MPRPSFVPLKSHRSSRSVCMRAPLFISWAAASDTLPPAFSAARYDAVIWMVRGGLRMSCPSIPSNRLRVCSSSRDGRTTQPRLPRDTQAQRARSLPAQASRALPLGDNAISFHSMGNRGAIVLVESVHLLRGQRVVDLLEDAHRHWFAPVRVVASLPGRRQVCVGPPAAATTLWQHVPCSRAEEKKRPKRQNGRTISIAAAARTVDRRTGRNQCDTCAQRRSRRSKQSRRADRAYGGSRLPESPVPSRPSRSSS